MSDTDNQRYRIVRRCICTSQDRAGGWGCCCSSPKTVVPDPDGDLVLIQAAEVARLQAEVEPLRLLALELAREVRFTCDDPLHDEQIAMLGGPLMSDTDNLEASDGLRQ